jgi:Zn-dependent peptidase ImmA (M78 family)
VSEKSPDSRQTKVRYGLARKRAEGILAALGPKGPPVDVRGIAKKLGLEIVVEDLDDGISGLLTTAETQRTICVNKKHSRNRQRFSIAHEIGHHQLGHQFVPGEHVHVDRGVQISQRSGRSSEAVDSKEIEANQFAACLLMPKTMLEAEVKLPVSDEQVTELAKKFGVSEQAMTIRLSRLSFL